MKQRKRLKLNVTQTLSHYAIVLFLLFIPFFTLYDLFEIFVTKTYDGVRSATELMITGFPWIIPAIFFYFLQKKKLKFKEVSTSYSIADFEEAIERTVKELDLVIEFNRKNFFRANRPSNWTMSWGEMITIIHTKDSFLINSICDPNNPSSIFSFGWNMKNMRTFLQNLQDVNNHKPPTVTITEKPINEWTFKRSIIRVIIYPFCLFFLILGVYMIFNPINIKSQIAGVGAISAATFYLYLDLKIITSKKHKE